MAMNILHHTVRRDSSLPLPQNTDNICNAVASCTVKCCRALLSYSSIVTVSTTWNRDIAPIPHISQDIEESIFILRIMDTRRRRMLSTLNSRYLYGKVVRSYSLVMISRRHQAKRARAQRHLSLKLNTDIYVFHFQPLLHAIIFFIEMAITSRLIAKFNSYYADKPGLQNWKMHL